MNVHSQDHRDGMSCMEMSHSPAPGSLSLLLLREPLPGLHLSRQQRPQDEAETYVSAPILEQVCHIEILGHLEQAFLNRNSAQTSSCYPKASLLTQ